MARDKHSHRDTETQRFEVSEAAIGAALEVHRLLGPGLFESVYEAAMVEELRLRGIRFRQQVELPVVYKGVTLAQNYRVDLIVEDALVLELKAIERLAPIHTAQVLTYLRLLQLPTGLLINFNEAQLRQGIKRVSL